MSWFTDIFLFCVALDLYYEENNNTDLCNVLSRLVPNCKGEIVFSASYGKMEFKEFVYKFVKLCNIERLKEYVYGSSIHYETKIAKNGISFIQTKLKRHDITFNLLKLDKMLGLKTNNSEKIKEKLFSDNLILQLFIIMDDIHFNKGIKQLKTIVYKVHQKSQIKTYYQFNDRNVLGTSLIIKSIFIKKKCNFITKYFIRES